MKFFTGFGGLLFVIIAASPSNAWAWDDLERMSFANALGTVLASEVACGYSYDQGAIQSLVGSTVPAHDMDFAPMLSAMTMGQEMQIKDLSASSLTARCAAVAQSAMHYGLIKNTD